MAELTIGGRPVLRTDGTPAQAGDFRQGQVVRLSTVIRAACAMREAAKRVARLNLEQTQTLMADPKLSSEGREKALVAIITASAIEAKIGDLPLPNVIALDDPFTEGQKRQLDEALHFQNALVDLLGEPTEKLEPWALAKIKAMQDELAAAKIRIFELETENETLGSVNNDLTDFIGRETM